MMSRESIIKSFAEWTAFSATRSGCPIKSRKDVYPLIRVPKYDEILYGNNRITSQEFDKWHRANTMNITYEANNRLPVGWAAKLINVYLKTRAYIAREGRGGLIECIHPPIDNELWRGIEEEYSNEREIIEKTHIVSKIKEITTYEIYQTILEGCRLIAEKRRCYLIEVEELWQGTRV
ncbi:MAG: hypothetical protein E4G94_12025 [ANME-2 cluster archaeon]|nr:MAG: hypothetical protein E4G94_12025 [ANME-2 cluster archaeon]